MNNMLSPKAMHLAVLWALEGAVGVMWPLDRTVGVAVRRAVEGAVDQALRRAVRVSPTHPNLDKFIEEIEQNWSVA